MCKIKYEKQRERETGKVSPERRKHAKSVSSKENVNLFKKKKRKEKVSYADITVQFYFSVGRRQLGRQSVKNMHYHTLNVNTLHTGNINVGQIQPVFS